MSGTYQTGIHIKQGAEEMVIPSGCKITVESGGELDLDSGATISLPDAVMQAADLALADGKILIGDTGGKAVAQTPTGDVTIDHDGATTIGAKKVTAAKIAAAVGTVLVGTKTSGDVTALDSSAEGAIPIGQGATETMAAHALSGDVTMDKEGAVTIGAKKVTAAKIAAAVGTVLVGTKTSGDVTALDSSAEGAIPIGQGATETMAAHALSGDVTMDKEGVVTIGANKVTSGMLGLNVGLVVACSGADTMSREENLAGLSSALTLVNEIRGDVTNHFGNATRHITGLQDLTGIPDAATELATLLALSGFLLTAYAAHNADVIKGSEWAYHDAQDTTHALVSAVTPTTLQEAVTRLNDLKAKYNAHELESTGHHSVGTVAADQVAAADADYGAVNRVPVSGALSGDIPFWSILNDGTGNVTGVSAAVNVADFLDFTFSGDPQNDAIISYILVRPAA